MKVDPTDFALDLIEANVVEALEAGSIYSPNAMIWYEEVFFPSHEYVLTLARVCDVDRTLSCVLLVWTECAELGPVTQVNFSIGAPIIVLCDEAVLITDDLAFEIRGKGWVISSQACPLC